jgi:thiamine biosynthesis lipoprotein ApbE
MGAVFTVVSYGGGVEAAFEELVRVERVISHRIPGSAWGDRSVAEVARLLDLCEEYRRVTDGAFDIGEPPDPGGIGKGYAVDRMAAFLRAPALIVAGGSSIYAMGCPPTDTRGWPIEIKDPRNPRRSASRYFLKDAALTTSSSALVRGARVPQVSVVTPSATEGEVWAKAFLVHGRDWTVQHKGDFEVFFCDDVCAWL